MTDFQPLRDFECAPDAMRPHRLEMAREQLRQMALVGADLLLCCSTTSPLAIDDPERAAEDLRTLATLADAARHPHLLRSVVAGGAT